VERAEILREKAPTQPLLSRRSGQYTWRDVGSSYLPGRLAALLFAQARKSTSASSRGGRDICGITKRDCAAGPKRAASDCPLCPPNATKLPPVLPADAITAERNEFDRHLRAQGIHAIFHYLPLHLSQMGRRFGGRDGDCP